jgi:hypothetical protein
LSLEATERRIANCKEQKGKKHLFVLISLAFNFVEVICKFAIAKK